MRTALVVLAIALPAAQAGATCNVIPSTDRVFPSALGNVSRPFARPGDVVIVRRDEPVFSRDAGGDRVTLAFLPPGADDRIVVGPVATLSRLAGSGCGDDDCTPGGCRCLRFAFPDTDAQVAPAGDGRPLVGPVEITVRTAGGETARIGKLVIGDSGFADDLFPHFVALPPANRFADLLAGAGGNVLAAEDTAGNLFVPLDFAGIVGDDERRTRFLEAAIPTLGDGGSVHVDVFTVAGQRLPPLVRQLQARGDDLVGTADSRESVFRIEKGALRPGLVPLDAGGPTIIPTVKGLAEERWQADPATMIVGGRFAVYEARECDPADVPDDGCTGGQPLGASCLDLNDNGSTFDYILYALDLTVPHARPIEVDSVDACAEFAGFPRTFPAFGLYSFSANDALVAFRIIEGGVDMNGNGRSDDLLGSGAFDLERGVQIALAKDSPRQEIGGSLLAFTQPVGDPAGPDALFFYDAASPSPAPELVHDDARARFLVTRHAVGRVERGPRVFPFDLAVAGGRIGFVVPEAAQGEDLTGDGDPADGALLVFDAAARTVTSLRQAITSRFDDATLAMTPQALAFQTERAGPFGSRLAVGVRLMDQPGAVTRFVCDRSAAGEDGLLAPSVSEAIVPCLAGGAPGQLRALLGNGTERDLGLKVAAPADVQVSEDVLVVGVDETLQGADLDGDGTLEPGPVLHAFHAFREHAPVNFRRRIIRSTPPFLQFISRGVVVLSAGTDGPVRTILRDVDGDGVLEEPIPGPGGGPGPIADNCPTIPNPDQADANGDGLGDPCQCPVLRVETVRGFTGSQVRVPVDFEPGAWPVAVMNFDLDYDAGLPSVAFRECRRGPVVRTAGGYIDCTDVPPVPPGVARTVITNRWSEPIPILGAGELASFDLDLSRGTRGESFPVCIDPSTVTFGAPDGELACPPPRHCGEVRIDPSCERQGDCNCDGQVTSGDRVCLIAKFFDPSLRVGDCGCADCNLNGRLNAADAPCITQCIFGNCFTTR